MEQGRQGAGDGEDLHPEAARAQGGQARGSAAGEEDRGRGGGARGGKMSNNTGKNPPENPGPMGTIKQTKDAEGIYNFQQSNDGKVILNHRGHPLCYYCGIPSHQRSACRLRLRDVDNGIKRPFHPARGNLPSGNQLRKEAQIQISNAADQWGNPWTGSPVTQTHGPQWPTMTIVITDPEDQKWLAQATSSGWDPASVITTCRQRQQQHSRSLVPIENNPQTTPRVSSLLPSGLVACNECAHVSATFEQSDDHCEANHSKLAGRPNGRN